MLISKSLSVACFPALLVVGGCTFPNSSNPTLAIDSASVPGDSATLAITVDNPSAYDLHLHAIEWELSQGPLPVANGTWETHAQLPQGGSYSLTNTINYDSPSLDPSAGTVELIGTMLLTADEGDSETTMGNTSFATQAAVNGGG